MFENFDSSQRSHAKKMSVPVVLSILFHACLVVAIVAAPFLVIKQLPPPSLTVEIYESTPPPPPPPPGGNNNKPKEKQEPKPKPDTLKEPTKVTDTKPQDSGPANPGGVEGGVEGGVAGGVVGGVLTDLPPQMTAQAQRRISGQDPYYPPEARAERLTATVAARVCISASGQVTSVKILRGVPLFNRSVEQAVNGWRYEPYMVAGRAVPACFPVYFNFNLQE